MSDQKERKNWGAGMSPHGEAQRAILSSSICYLRVCLNQGLIIETSRMISCLSRKVWRGIFSTFYCSVIQRSGNGPAI